MSVLRDWKMADEDGLFGGRVVDAQGRIVAEVFGGIMEDGVDQGPANAAVIAAAPDLLRACGLYWKDNPQTHRKEVWTADGSLVFTSEHTGMGGAVEAAEYCADARIAALTKARVHFVPGE